MTNEITATPGQWKLAGIEATAGQCDCCSRALTQRVFTVSHPELGKRQLGRRCAAKATGYAPTALDRQLASALRIAEVARRVEIVAAAFPAAAAELATAQNAYTESGEGAYWAALTPAAQRMQNATTEDAWWGGRGWTAYANWQEYMVATP